MTQLHVEDVQKIAELAKLSIPESTLSALTTDLKNILNLVAKMDRVDTTQVEPLAHPVDTCQPFREDKVTEKNERALFQEIAPQTESGLYLVPKFMETE